MFLFVVIRTTINLKNLGFQKHCKTGAHRVSLSANKRPIPSKEKLGCYEQLRGRRCCFLLSCASKPPFCCEAQSGSLCKI